MKIHREGYNILFYSILVLILVNIISVLLIKSSIVFIILISLSVLIIAFILYFFRKTERKIDEDEGRVVSSADGKVVAIEEVQEDEYFNDRRLQVSVFMSLFDEHSNTYPVSGKIKYVKHHKGKFYPANYPKSSVYNERSTIVIENDKGTEIMIRQIAGAIARRIVTYAAKDSSVRQGEELGFIKFGSRVDIFLPAGTEVKVNLHQLVRANRDTLALL